MQQTMSYKYHWLAVAAAMSLGSLGRTARWQGQPKKKGHRLVFFVGPPLALITVRIRWFSMGLRSGLGGGQSMCENDLMLPEPLFHNLSLMNPGVVIFEFARAIREENIHS